MYVDVGLAYFTMSHLYFDQFGVCAQVFFSTRGRGGGGLLGLMFAGYVPLASQSRYPIIVYFLANYRPHLSHFLENVIFAIPT